MQQFDITFMKIGLEKGFTHLGSKDLGSGGSGSVSGFRVRRDRSRITEVDLVASGKQDLVWCRGRIGLALVGVVLVVVKTLSGPRVGSDLASGGKYLAFRNLRSRPWSSTMILSIPCRRPSDPGRSSWSPLLKSIVCIPKRRSCRCAGSRYSGRWNTTGTSSRRSCRSYSATWQ